MGHSPIHSGPEQENSAVTSCHVWKTAFYGTPPHPPGLTFPAPSSKIVVETEGGGGYGFVQMSHLGRNTQRQYSQYAGQRMDLCIK